GRWLLGGASTKQDLPPRPTRPTWSAPSGSGSPRGSARAPPARWRGRRPMTGAGRPRLLRSEDDFDHPVLLFLELLVGARRLGEREVVGGESVHPERVIVGEQGQDVVDPRLHVGLPLADLNL